MRAYILIKIKTGEIVDALMHLRKLKEMVKADMTFGPYDIIANIEADNLNAIGRVVASEIQPLPGVLETLTCLEVEPA